MNENQRMKTKFRTTAKWKKFRSKLKKERKYDAVTGKPLLKGWNLHHCDLNESHYSDISNEDNFECLNKNSHEFVHWLFRYKNWREVLANTYKILNKMERLNDEGTERADSRVTKE